jgi:hypothetical protein
MPVTTSAPPSSGCSAPRPSSNTPRGFVSDDELKARDDATMDLLADRATERILRRGRILGREL